LAKVNGPQLYVDTSAVTTTLHVVALLGTVTVMLVALQYAAVPALVPPKVTVLLPWLVPKLAPVMVTAIPTGPDVGQKLVTLGGVVTVKDAPLLVWPATVTTTLPEAAPLGTGTTILVLFQLVGVADAPLNVTVFVP